jgi:hypothetical protein
MSLWRKRGASDTNCDTIAPNVHHNGQNQPKWFNMTALANNDLSIKSDDLSIKSGKETGMTLQEIEELAGHRKVSPWVVKLVGDAVAKEREACAEIAEKQRYAMYISLTSYPPQNGTAVGIANQIRARGQA